MTEYCFRIGRFYEPEILQLVDDELRVLDKDRHEKRRIRLDQIRSIQIFDHPLANTDPDSGSFRLEFWVLKLMVGKRVVMTNGYYLRPDYPMTDIATNQTESLNAFMSELKSALRRIQPGLKLVYGNRGASIAWGISIFLGIGIFIIGIAVFLTDRLTTALIPGLFCTVSGVVLTSLGVFHAKNYWPKTITLEQELNQIPQVKPLLANPLPTQKTS